MYDIALATLLSIPCYWHHSMYCCAQVTVLEPDLKKSSNVQYGTVALNQSNNLEWKLTIPPDTEVPVRLVYSVEYPINLFVQGLPK